MKVSRARFPVQILLHLLILGHLFAYYSLGWKNVGGTDVQAFFHDFLGSGLVSAGVILLAVAFLLTLVFGRIFCGWGCHFGGFQDLSAWVLRKLGLHPPPLRTRFLHHLPYALLLFTFILPPALRWMGSGSPPPGNQTRFELRVDLRGDPWANLPGAALSAVTFLACGTGILLFLGTRGFCRYVCPYGAAFRLLDPAAPYRVRRRGACGSAACAPGDLPDRPPPCTAACPMGVAVHEETRLRGQVRDADCIRCNLCVEACPREALAMSFRPLGAHLPGPARPPAIGPAGSSVHSLVLDLPIVSRTAGEIDPAGSHDRPPPRYTFSLRREAFIAATVVVAFLAWDVVYAAHFLAAAMALGEGFLACLALEVLRSGDLKALGLTLRSGGRFTFAGAAVPAIFLLTLVGILHAGTFKGFRLMADIAYHEHASGEHPGTARAHDERALASTEARGSLERAALLYRRALDCFPGDRLTLHRYAAVLASLGDREALKVAEELVARDPGDRDARELLRRVRSAVALDNHPALR